MLLESLPLVLKGRIVERNDALVRNAMLQRHEIFLHAGRAMAAIDEREIDAARADLNAFLSSFQEKNADLRGDSIGNVGFTRALPLKFDVGIERQGSLQEFARIKIMTAQDVNSEKLEFMRAIFAEEFRNGDQCRASRQTNLKIPEARRGPLIDRLFDVCLECFFNSAEIESSDKLSFTHFNKAFWFLFSLLFGAENGAHISGNIVIHVQMEDEFLPTCKSPRKFFCRSSEFVATIHCLSPTHAMRVVWCG